MQNSDKDRLPSMRCVLLGEEPLVSRAGQHLLDRGHTICAIVTESVHVAAWAGRRNIRVLGRKGYQDWIRTESFDLLFSITHPALIDPEVIALARRGAYNFHDGPLPRYAGMNGSAWAIAHQERHHAIVWHVLTSGLDAGDIVARRDTQLDDRETSLSLNMRNSVAAFEAFVEVLDGIESGTLSKTPQDPNVARTEYSRHDRPASLGALDFERPAAALDAMVRAAEFGKFSNPFGLSKIVRGDKAIVVRETRVLPARTDAACGQVLLISKDSLQIQTASGILEIIRVSSRTGRPLGLMEAAEYLGLTEGTSASSDFFCSSEENRAVSKSEAYYIKKLTHRVVPQLPYAEVSADELAVPVDLPSEFSTSFDGEYPVLVSALLGLTLTGPLLSDRFTIGLVYPDQSGQKFRAVLAPVVPMDIDLSTSERFTDLISSLDAQYQTARARPGFLFDVVARSPDLRNDSDLAAERISTLNVVVGPSDAPKSARISVCISEQQVVLKSDGSVSQGDLETLALRLVTVAKSLLWNTSNPLVCINSLSAEEFQQQVFDWNSTAHDYSQEARIFDLFESQVDANPNAPALVCRGAMMTFKEVEEAANRVCHALRARGIGPGQFVGLRFSRGFDLVIALLGIAKSGAAYIPIDLSFPVDRALFILTDAQAALLFTSTDLRADVAFGGPILCIEDDAVVHAPTERVPCSATSDDVCYVIFTSGSTGAPKGAVLTHRAVVNTLEWVNRTFSVTPNDRLLFVTSPSFDLSVYDVFGALGAGASIDIATSELLSDPKVLANYVCQSSITIWDSAPPALSRIAPFFPDQPERPALRLVMLSGDWIPVGLPPRLMERFAGVQVKSLGGATEAAIWSNYFHVEQVDPTWTSIPYGFPIQNARYYILDHKLRPLPRGTTGDLYIGGTCLSIGYLNRPELTQERFLPDPFLPGERIYKTGDLARFFSDGCMEFLGRADFQVKIRGYRVEIGEVESLLLAQPNVRDAVCIAAVDGSGHKSLIGYVVRELKTEVDPEVVKAALATKLPEYMVPSFVIVLDEFPLSPNGKLDRKALPSPEQALSMGQFEPPKTPEQQRLAQVWQEVFGRKQVGIRDDFFALGGHSLMAVALVSKIKQTTGTEMPLSVVLESSTIERQAEWLKQKSSGDPSQYASTGSSNITHLRPGSGAAFFFIYDGEGETLLYRNLAQRMPQEFNVFGIMPKTLQHIPLAHVSIEDMATHCISEMQKVCPHGPYQLGGLCAGGVISFEIAAQLEAMGEQVARVILLDAFEPTAKPRRGVITQRRMSRLREVLSSDSDDDPSYRQRGKQHAASLLKVSTKLARAAHYETTRQFYKLSVAARLLLLSRVLERNESWPDWVRPLTIRDIYTAARDRYRAPQVQCENVILIKASQSVPGVKDDDPASEHFLDEDLGWKRHTKKGFSIVSVQGGHSSMLQEPWVQDLATRLGNLLLS